MSTSAVPTQISVPVLLRGSDGFEQPGLRHEELANPVTAISVHLSAALRYLAMDRPDLDEVRGSILLASQEAGRARDSLNGCLRQMPIGAGDSHS